MTIIIIIIIIIIVIINSHLLSQPTHESVYQHIVQSGIAGKTTNNLAHVDTSTAKHAIIDAIVV